MREGILRLLLLFIPLLYNSKSLSLPLIQFILSQYLNLKALVERQSTLNSEIIKLPANDSRNLRQRILISRNLTKLTKEISKAKEIINFKSFKISQAINISITIFCLYISTKAYFTLEHLMIFPSAQIFWPLGYFMMKPKISVLNYLMMSQFVLSDLKLLINYTNRNRCLAG